MESSLAPTKKIKLFLAPMEGVTDNIFRDIITGIDDSIDYCVTEFIRVTTSLHPKKLYYRYAPELHHDSRTRSGVPVLIQLLGGQPDPLAENAVRAIELGAYGIDLNFGCPAKIVNRHDGGATLLKSPERLFNIASTVRKAVPAEKSVSAKIRLGCENPNLLFENIKALEEANVSWITVHCRTKEQGYRPPAHWQWINLIKEKSKIPLVVNGDIFTLEDFHRCQKLTNADAFMIGRGALKNPFLFKKIREHIAFSDSHKYDWQHVSDLIFNLHHKAELKINSAFAAARTKQWLKYLSLESSEARLVFENTKRFRANEFTTALFQNINKPFQATTTSLVK